MSVRKPIPQSPFSGLQGRAAAAGLDYHTDLFGGLSGTDRDAYTALKNLFSQFGLDSLSGRIVDFLKQGYSQDTIAVLLQDTPEYKQRFAANEARKKAGLPVLTPTEYLATERSYRQIMQQAGLPPGFYDQPSDFQKFLETDMSPTELKGRLDVAQDYLNNADKATMDYFKQFYSTGDMLAYALDPKRAQPLIEQKYKAAQVGGAAADQGVGIDTSTATQLAQLGVTRDQASQGFGFIAQEQGTVNKLDALYGGNVNQNDLVQEVFANSADATQRRAKLGQQEKSAFSGNNAVGKTSLGTSTGGQY